MLCTSSSLYDNENLSKLSSLLPETYKNRCEIMKLI